MYSLYAHLLLHSKQGLTLAYNFYFFLPFPRSPITLQPDYFSTPLSCCSQKACADHAAYGLTGKELLCTRRRLRAVNAPKRALRHVRPAQDSRRAVKEAVHVVRAAADAEGVDIKLVPATAGLGAARRQRRDVALLGLDAVGVHDAAVVLAVFGALNNLGVFHVPVGLVLDGAARPWAACASLGVNRGRR